MREYTTQMDAARKGIVTPEIKAVAEKEHMTSEALMKLVAEGKVAICANRNHTCLNPEGVGSMLRTKINVNLGVSRDCKDYDIEMQKVMSAVNLGAEAIMDLSSHGNTQPFRRKLTSECPAMIGTVPVYDSVIHYQRDLATLTARDFIDVIRMHAEDGVDFVTLHCGITRKTIEQIKKHKRKMNIVSRGGSLVFAWMSMTGEENPFYEYFDEILDKDIDVVHLCLPHFLHPVMAIKAMKAGINVLTEKPIATCLQDADRMIRTAEETHVKLGVIFQTRYTKSVEKLREMIQRGDFGKILTARSYLTWNRPLDYYSGSDWKGTWNKEGGGVLIDQAIHSIDRVRYMLDSDVEWIDGSVHNYVHHFVKVEDAADAAIMFKNGCLYNLYACNIYGADSPINIELIGEKGRLGLKQDMGYYELDGTYAEIRNTYETTNVGPDYWGSSHHLQIRDFYRSVREDLPVAIDGLEGRKTLEMVKGIYLSSARRERISLPFEDVTYSDLNQPVK